MKLRDLVPPEVLRELEEVAHELHQEMPHFDPVKDPIDRMNVLLTWCVREIVRMRKEAER